jgi:hypothetical protein
VPLLAKGLTLAEGLNREDLQVNADEEEDVDDGPGHVRNVLHKRRAGLKKKLKTLTNPSTKRKTREREGRGHPEPLKSNFLRRRSSKRDTFGDLRSSLTLPSTYLVAERNEENETRYRKVPFGRVDAIRQFDGAFLTHGNLVSGNIEMSRMSWLQNRIVWEPVDGQHIVAACHLAKEDFLQGRMSTEVYNRSYAKHKARVIMFNQPQVYIEASVRINAKEFERDFYTTLYEDMVSLCAI